MDSQLVTVHNGKVTTSSLTVAERFNKRHDDVLRAIRTSGCSSDFSLRNFAESTYSNSRNRKFPCYCITRDGFMFLVMGFTGKEAAMWKERFINAFNEMEAKLRQRDMNKTALDHLKGQTLRMTIGYDGKLSFEAQDSADYWYNIAKAIKDPSNYGLNDEKIQMIADACIEALVYRAGSRKVKLDEARRQMKQPQLLS